MPIHIGALGAVGWNLVRADVSSHRKKSDRFQCRLVFVRFSVNPELSQNSIGMGCEGRQ